MYVLHSRGHERLSGSSGGASTTITSPKRGGAETQSPKP